MHTNSPGGVFCRCVWGDRCRSGPADYCSNKIKCTSKRLLRVWCFSSVPHTPHQAIHKMPRSCLSLGFGPHKKTPATHTHIDYAACGIILGFWNGCCWTNGCAPAGSSETRTTRTKVLRRRRLFYNSNFRNFHFGLGCDRKNRIIKIRKLVLF